MTCAPAPSRSSRPGPSPTTRSSGRGFAEQRPGLGDAVEPVPRAERAREHRDGVGVVPVSRREAVRRDGVRHHLDPPRSAFPRVVGERPAHGEDGARVEEREPLQPIGLCPVVEATVALCLGEQRRVQLDDVRDPQRARDRGAGSGVQREPLVQDVRAERAHALLEPRGPFRLGGEALGGGRASTRTRQALHGHAVVNGRTGATAAASTRTSAPVAGEGRRQLLDVDGRALRPADGDPRVGREVGDAHQAASGKSERRSTTFSASEKCAST